MDMWRPFRNSVQRKTPKARIVFDKFHIMLYLGDALDEVRRSEYRRLAGKDRSYIKGSRYVLLSNRENLSVDGRRALQKLLTANRRLNTACVLNETFGQLWEYRTERGARAFFERWQASLKWQRLEPYRKFAAMIERHWDGIASYCEPENKVSLGMVEGLNNKIRVLQRRAYGYRDEEYLELKIIAAFLPGCPDRSKMAHSNPRRPRYPDITSYSTTIVQYDASAQARPLGVHPDRAGRQRKPAAHNAELLLQAPRDPTERPKQSQHTSDRIRHSWGREISSRHVADHSGRSVAHARERRWDVRFHCVRQLSTTGHRWRLCAFVSFVLTTIEVDDARIHLRQRKPPPHPPSRPLSRPLPSR